MKGRGGRGEGRVNGGERAGEKAGGEVRARQAQGGAGRGAVALRAAPALEGKLRPREGGGTGRETSSADTASMCGTGWGLAHRSGVWQYYGMERP